VSAVEVHHRVDGDGPPVLLLNSLGSDLSMWDPQLPTLGHRRVIRYDTRGHGRSPAPDGRYSMDDLGADALALLDRLDVERADLVGLSLGGMTAMWLAAHAPARVGRMVLFCTTAYFPPKSMWADRAALVRAEGTEVVAAAAVGRWVTPGWAAAHPAIVAALEAMVAATPAAGYAGACAAIEDMDLRPDLSRITAPTLVISGAEDPATPPARGREIAAGIAGSRFEILADAAHLASFQQPEAANRLIREALDG
jgi:3-oxoadipate enol-lactonase